MSKAHEGKKQPNISKSLKGRKITWGHKISLSNRGKIGWLRGKRGWKNKGSFKFGKLHPMWKGGISSENMKIRHGLEYEIWRNKVYRKDYWTCRLCGYKGQKIVAHHLKLFSEFPELRFSIDNGITLCRSCHAKVHKNKAYLKEKLK